MNTLQRYILRQVVVSLVLSVFVFSGILLAGNVLKQLLELLTNKVPFWEVMSQIGYLVPFVLTFSLPMGMMTACLLVFGRLSADNEIGAMRACGLSFWQVISPVVLVAFLLSIICLAFNLEMAPHLKLAFKDNLARLGLTYPTALMEEGRFNDQFPGYLIYVGRVKREHIRDVTIYQLDQRGNVVQNIRAARGTLEPRLADKQIQVKLEDVRFEVRDPQDPNDPQKVRPGVVANDYQLVLDVSQLMEPAAKRKTKDQMTFTELVPAILMLRQKGIDVTPWLVRAHEQWAISFACLSFAMIGIPFGIRAHRRETTIGISIALGLSFGYYFLIIVAKAFSNKPDMWPEALIWAPNLLFQLIGLVMLWRTSRVGAV